MATLDSSWDMIDDLPLRWATDFVPLASSGSRLLKSDINFFHLKKDTVTGFRGPSMLAVATKQSILLYDTPKGERAFRFIKVSLSASLSIIKASLTTITGILHSAHSTKFEFCPTKNSGDSYYSKPLECISTFCSVLRY